VINSLYVNVPIILLGCEHTGGNNTFSPIAWPYAENGGAFVRPGARLKELSVGTYRDVWLWLPRRTRFDGGRVVVTTLGSTGSAGTLALPDYTVYRTQLPAFDQAAGLFNSTSGQQEAASAVTGDAHTSGNWGTILNTNIDLTMTFVSQPLLWFSDLALRVRAPYGNGSGSYGMYVMGLAVQNW
jgi:hypothetical protein